MISRRTTTRFVSLAVLIGASLIAVSPSSAPAQSEVIYGLRTKTVTDTAQGQEHLVSVIERYDPTTGDRSMISASTPTADRVSAPFPTAYPKLMYADAHRHGYYFHSPEEGGVDLWRFSETAEPERLGRFASAATVHYNRYQLVALTRLDADRWVVRHENGTWVYDTSDWSTYNIDSPFNPASYNVEDGTVLSADSTGVFAVDFETGDFVRQVWSGDLVTNINNNETYAAIARVGGGYAVHGYYKGFQPPPIMNEIRTSYANFIEPGGTKQELWKISVQYGWIHTHMLAGSDLGGIYVAGKNYLTRRDVTDPELPSTRITPESLTANCDVSFGPTGIHFIDAPVFEAEPGETIDYPVVSIDSAWNASNHVYSFRRYVTGNLDGELRGSGPVLPTDGQLVYDYERDLLILTSGEPGLGRILEIDPVTGDRTLVGDGDEFGFDSVVLGPPPQ